MRTRNAPISAPDGRDAAVADGRIGPNAAIQLIAALRSRREDEALGALFADAGLSAWLTQPPEAMIDQRDAMRLHQGVRRALPPDKAESVLAEAGRLTAEYLLENRIPRFAQVILRLLPPRLSAAALSKAIAANAWTFAGSGRFEAKVGREVEYRIYANPLAEGAHSDTPICIWNAAVFETLFRQLVSKRARAEEVACVARGDSCCRFRLTWKESATGASNPAVFPNRAPRAP